jgi:hypothetical protein
MSFLRGLDLYKGIVLVSLLLLPAAGGWVWSLHGGIEATQRALAEATRPRGLIEEIGQLQRQMETVVRNKTRDEVATRNHGEYFEGKIITSQRGGGLSKDDFTISKATPVNATIGGGQRVTDLEVEIAFGKQGGTRSDMALPRDFIWAVLYNSEQQIWKLRTLEIQNATDERSLTTRRTPPPELEDKWLVRRLKFVRREPGKDR